MGRPGWHIECSAMSDKYLGLTLRHPRRRRPTWCSRTTRTSAPSPSAACGCTFANYWMHGGMLQIANVETGETEMMSKSLGNFLLLREVLEQVRPAALRMLMLQSALPQPARASASERAGRGRRGPRAYRERGEGPGLAAGDGHAPRRGGPRRPRRPQLPLQPRWTPRRSPIVWPFCVRASPRPWMTTSTRRAALGRGVRHS